MFAVSKRRRGHLPEVESTGDDQMVRFQLSHIALSTAYVAACLYVCV